MPHSDVPPDPPASSDAPHNADLTPVPDAAIQEEAPQATPLPKHLRKRASKPHEAPSRRSKTTPESSVPDPKPQAADAPPPPRQTKAPEAHPLQSSRRSRFWNRPRKLAVLIAIVVVATVTISVRQARVSHARSIVNLEFEAGLAAVSDQDWVQARNHFERAGMAVEILRRRDPEANTIQQFRAETTALTRLSSNSLFDLLEEGERVVRKDGTETWRKNFARRDLSPWYVIEGTLEPTSDQAAAKLGYSLEMSLPVIIGETVEIARVQVGFRNVSQLASELQKSDSETVSRFFGIFGAQVRDCFPDENDTWIIRLNPDTSFLWVNRPTYEATNLHLGSILSLADLQELLKTQGEWAGVTP